MKPIYAGVLAATLVFTPMLAATAKAQANTARTYAKPSDAVLRHKLTKLQYSVTLFH